MLFRIFWDDVLFREIDGKTETPSPEKQISPLEGSVYTSFFSSKNESKTKCIKHHFLQTICVKQNLQGVDFFEKISKIRNRRSDTRRRAIKKAHGKNSNTTYTKIKIRQKHISNTTNVSKLYTNKKHI